MSSFLTKKLVSNFRLFWSLETGIPIALEMSNRKVLMKSYPEGTIIGNYFVSPDQGGFCIRRNVQLPDGSKPQPRYPKAKYKHLKTKAELGALVLRLNHEEGRKAKERIEIRTAFIPVSIMEGFRAMLQVAVPNEKDFNYLYNTVLQTYFLNFFVTSLGLPDPKQWARNEELWGAALLGKSEHIIFDMHASAKTIKTTVDLANRFMKFLNQKMRDEYPLVVFAPISTGALKTHEAERLIDKEDIGKYIEFGDWIQINANLPKDIAPHIRLLYYYGLRRAESLGFKNTIVIRDGCLVIKEQLKLVNKFKPLKDKESRMTPHWFCSPARAHRLIEQTLVKKMHPDTLGKKWSAFMKRMGMHYDLHDFRRTFITRALREYPQVDVQQAVGHESLNTTMRYAQDDRGLNDRIWIPPAS